MNVGSALKLIELYLGPKCSYRFFCLDRFGAFLDIVRSPFP